METIHPPVASSLYLYKRKAYAVCRDCHYKRVMPDCNERIKKAVSEAEISRILHTCRDMMFR